MFNSNNRKQEQSPEVVHSYTVKIIKKRLPTTAKMVDTALLELHTKNGVSFKKLCAFIEAKYSILLTNQRLALIKKRLQQLRDAKDLINKTGKGLLGSFRLENKNKFEKSVDNSITRHHRINTSTNVKTPKKAKSNSTAAPLTQVETSAKVAKIKVPSMPSMFDITNSVCSLSPVTPVQGRTMEMTPVSSLRVKDLNNGAARRLF